MTSIMNEMNEVNNDEMLEEDIVTENNKTGVEEMIVKCGDLITEAVNSNNTERLKGILQVCTIDTGMSEEELDTLVQSTMEGKYEGLSEEEIMKVTGGTDFNVIESMPIGFKALGVIVGVVAMGYGTFEVIKRKKMK